MNRRETMTLKIKRAVVIAGICLFAFILIQGNIHAAGVSASSTMARIQDTAQLVKEKEARGELDLLVIVPLMQDVGKYFKAGDLEQTNSLLDEVNDKLKAFNRPPNKLEKQLLQVKEKAEEIVRSISGKGKAKKDSSPESGQVVSSINTMGWEDTPFVSEDDKLYFTYSPHDFFRAHDTKFKEIVMRGPVRQGHSAEEYVTSPQILVVHNYVSERGADGGWGTPEPIYFEGGDVVGGSMWVSGEGDVMYLAGWPKKGKVNYGCGDIYVSTRQNEMKWSKPENLGRIINTKYLEDNPHFVENGQKLYFDSNRPGGRGGWDIYYSKRGPDGSWSKPVNMGDPINTQDTEGMAYFNEDGTRLYFTRGGKISGPTRLFFSELVNNTWLEPRLIDLGMSDINSPSFSSDGKELIFLWGDHKSNTIDIWFTRKKQDGSWGKPRPIDR